MSAVAVFERTVENPMRKSTGIYRDPENDTIENLLAAFLGRYKSNGNTGIQH